MATQIYLGNPPENIKQFIIKNYGPKEDPMLKVPLTFTAEDAGATFKLKKLNDIDEVKLETSIDNGETWQPHINGTLITLNNVGDSIMFRNSENNIQVFANSIGQCYYFDINNGKIAASGNIMFLMDKTGELKDLSKYEGCFHGLFTGCSSLTQSPILPATKLSFDCYNDLFTRCESLPEPKYKMINMPFDDVANAIRNNNIFGYDNGFENGLIQCYDALMYAEFDGMNWAWNFSKR